MQYFLCAVWLLTEVHAGTAVAASADQLTDAVQSAVASAEPAIVRIRTIGARSAEGETGLTSVTTGVVISEDGAILTSAFALQGNPQAVLVESPNGTRVQASVVATDHLRKLVLLQASEGRFTPPMLLAPAGEVRAGQWAVALGRYFSAEASNVSVGVISALNRIHGLATQTDAKISPVNYGGPLVDLQGRFVGILVPMSPRGRDDLSAGVEWYDSGIGFAIPMHDALEAARRLQADGDQFPGLLGVTLSAPSPWSRPVTISEVHPGGPAALAGVKPGDELVSVDGIAITRTAIFESIIGSRYAGSRLALELKRGEESISCEAELVAKLQRAGYGYLGLVPVASADVEDQSADVAVAILPRSPAADVGLQNVILLHSLNQIVVDSIPTLVTTAGGIRPGESVELEYRESDAAELKTLTLQAGQLPFNPVELPAETRWPASVEPVTDAGTEDAQVQRQEISTGDSSRLIVLSAEVPGEAADQRPVLPGVVVLCSVQPDEEAEVLRRWERMIRQFSLQVVIPVNSDAARLSFTDAPEIRKGLAVLRQSAPYDPQRVIAVTGRGQTVLAAALAMTPRSPVRAAVITEGWFSPDPGVNLGQTRRAMLFMDQPSDAQSAALQTQAASLLREAGLRMFEWNVEAADATKSLERVVAEWSLLIKAL
jgi:serine protease Do